MLAREDIATRAAHRGSMSQSELRTVESRLVPIVAIIGVLALVEALPARYQLTPAWFPYVAGIVVIGSMIAVMADPSNQLFGATERWIMFAFCSLVIVLNVVDLGRLLGAMLVHRHDYSSLTLLESAVQIWFVNILAFA